MKKFLAIALLALTLVPAAASRANQQCLLTYLSEGIPDSTLNDPVNYQLEACCGTPPYRFEIVDGALPAGMHLNQNGKITGKPTEVTDTTVFIRLSDSAGCALTQAFAVRVEPEP